MFIEQSIVQKKLRHAGVCGKPVLLNFGNIQNAVINSTFSPLFSPHPLNRRLDWPPAGLKVVKKRTTSCSSLVTRATVLSRLVDRYIFYNVHDSVVTAITCAQGLKPLYFELLYKSKGKGHPVKRHY